MLNLTAGYVSGVILLYCTGTLPASSASWLLMAVGLAVLCCSPARFPLVRFVACLALGFSYAALRAEWALEPMQALNALSLTDMEFTGYICSSEAPRGAELALDLCDTELVATHGPRKFSKVRLVLSRESFARLSPYGMVQGRGRVERARSPVEGGFNERGWLYANGYQGVLFAQSVHNRALSACEFVCALHWVRLLTRDTLRSRLLDQLPNPTAGMFMAVILGDKTGLDLEIRDVFLNTGTMHLMVVSGLHIAVIAAAWFWFLSSFARMCRLVGVPVNARRASMVAKVLTFILVFSYVALIGFPVAATRALSMFVVAAFLYTTAHKPPILSVMMAIAAMLTFLPANCLLPGFWLSVSAVCLLLFVHANRYGKQNYVMGLTRTNTAFLILFAPVLSFIGLPVSITSLIANLVAIPWVSFFLVPIGMSQLVATVVLGTPVPLLYRWFGVAGDGLLSLLEPVSVWLPGTIITAPASVLEALLLFGLSATVFLPVSALFRLGCFAVVVAFYVQPPLPESQRLVQIFPSYKGVLVSVSDKDKAVLIHSGSAGHFARAAAIRHLSAMGYHKRVRYTLDQVSLDDACRAAQKIPVLHARLQSPGCILLVEVSGIRLLMVSRLGKEQLRQIAISRRQELSADVLVFDGGGLSWLFLKMVHPDILVFAGKTTPDREKWVAALENSRFGPDLQVYQPDREGVLKLIVHAGNNESNPSSHARLDVESSTKVAIPFWSEVP